MQPSRIIAGRFRLDQEAASGGMGTVFRAHDLQTGETVAIKILQLLTEEGRERFAREATLLAELSHPGIVRYIAHGISDKIPYLVTEWIEGQTLSQKLERQGLTIDETLTIIVNAAQALEEIHKHKLVHRDVKPSNLIFPPKRLEAVKIIDFGVARRAEAMGPTRTGMLIGSAGYMSPEQARGESHISARADIFSLGCVLYECLTGQAPFDGPDLLTVCAKILMLEPRPSQEVNREVPMPLSVITSRMMSKTVSARPNSMGEVIEVLRSLPKIKSKKRRRRTHGVEIPTQSLRGRDDETDPIGRSLRETHGAQEFSSLIWIGFVTDEKESLPLQLGSLSEKIGEIVSGAGGRLHQLRDDILVAEFRCDISSRDDVTRLARCALAAKALHPESIVSLSIARSDDKGSLFSDGPNTLAQETVSAAFRLATESEPRVRISRFAENILKDYCEVTRESGKRYLMAIKGDLPSVVQIRLDMPRQR